MLSFHATSLHHALPLSVPLHPIPESLRVCVYVSEDSDSFPRNSNKIQWYTRSTIKICCCHGNSQPCWASGSWEHNCKMKSLIHWALPILLFNLLYKWSGNVTMPFNFFFIFLEFILKNNTDLQNSNNCIQFCFSVRWRSTSASIIVCWMFVISPDFWLIAL